VEVAKNFFRLPESHPGAMRIAQTLPGYEFKGVPAFFDVGGLTADPEAFQMAIDLLVSRYASKKIDVVAGFDSRGFLLGPPVALALKIPFVMLRKPGKLPGPTVAVEYATEYSTDGLCCPCSAIRAGDRVMLIDDLLATGGTLKAGATLVQSLGAVVAECAVVVAIEFLKGWEKFHSDPKLSDVPIFSMIDAGSTPGMPEGSTKSFVFDVNGEEVKKIQEAMKGAPSGSVLVKNGDGSWTAAKLCGGEAKNTSYA